MSSRSPLTRTRGLNRRNSAILLAVAGAALLAVQVAKAQSTVDSFATVVPDLIVHAVQPGVATAGDDNAHARPLTADAVEPTAGGVSAGLVIIPTFDSTITGDPNAFAIEAAINTAISNITSQFSDPITVSIKFQKGPGLGSSSVFFVTGSYAVFLAALKGDAKTSDDATATSLLANVAANPVNGSTNINVKTANLRAVGINVNPPAGQPDGTITLNTTITSPGSPGSSLTYALIGVVEHEIDEVLGLGSSLPSVSSSTIFPEDLYRYSAVNTRSFTTANSLAFFSINGTTSFAQFDNQNDGGDFGDWQSNPHPSGVPPRVQDAFATPGANPALSVELNALDVIGYDRVSSPPTVVTGVASGIKRTSASLNGTANPNGTATTAFFQYGLTTAYGSATPGQALGAGSSPVAIGSGGLTGLACATLYHFRATVINAGGTTNGLDATFVTAPCLTVIGDYDGDRRADPTVFRPGTGYWYTLQSTSNYTTWLGQQWGVSTDIPVPGDYDGDGRTDLAIFRPSTGTWWILQSSSNYTTYVSRQWGIDSDIPVPGDYDGDGKTDLAIFRPSTGTWWILQSSSNYTTWLGQQWGVSTDIPVPGDYDGDGRTDLAIFRPSTGTWWILESSTNYTTYVSQQWGNGADIPVFKAP
jgi:hypothetical protein